LGGEFVEVRLPVLTPETEPFWLGGADGALRFLRCQSCGYYIHPPSPVCQVPEQPKVAVVGAGGGLWAGCLLLRKD
jgi:uncharacterized OB-fold protein